MEKAKVYRGIEFIRISELPKDQKEAIWNWTSREQIIKILIDDNLIEDALQFKDYTYWFENVFSVNEVEEVVTSKKKQQPIKSIKLAVGR